MESKKLHKKLLKYGTLVAAIASIGEAQSAVIYTDEIPDFSGAVGSQYFLDLNNDGTDDFRIWHNGNSNLYVSPLTAGNAVLGSGGATYAYPFNLSLNSPINAAAGTFFTNGFAGGFQSLNYGSCSFGNFCSTTNGYLGLSFELAGNTHYGWARLDVDAIGNVWSVKDYAYNDVADATILAGEMPIVAIAADSATNIIGLDINNNGNGTDLEVSFDAAQDETTLSEYRIIAVKASLVSSFDLATANAVAASNYTVITPSALTSYTQILSAASLDADGDAIASGVDYVIHVLTVADGVNATTNSLNNAAALSVLNTPADSASTLMLTDTGNNANSSDFSITFDAAANEAKVSEYRVSIVKTVNAGSFDLASAEALANTSYEAVVPTGAANYNPPISSGLLDSDGDAIVLGIPYSFFVLSIQDSVIANLNNLSASSNSETLNTTTLAASAIIGADVSDNANGEDLQVTFNAASSESNIAAYRIIAVTDASSAAFTLADALALAPTAFKEIVPTGGPYSELLNASQTDSDGAAIVLGQDYNIFLVSIADGTLANVSAMASTAATTVLNTTTDSSMNVVATDVADATDASDLEVSFDAASSESGIAVYRMVIVTDASSTAFTLADGLALAPSAYTEVLPNGGPYTGLLGAAQTDSDGGTIVVGQDYNVFVISIADGTAANLSSMVSTSTTVSLNSPTSPATNVVGADIADAGNGSDAQVTFDAATTETGLGEYRILLVKEASAASFDLATSEAVSSANYVIVNPNATASYSYTFSANSNDVDGDLIMENVVYRAFVLSVGDDVIANLGSLSSPSDTFTLKSAPVGIRSNVSLDGKAFVNGSNNILIELSSSALKDGVSASLYNLLGKNVRTKQLNDAITELETTQLVSGIYLLVLENNKGATQTIKLILK